MTLNNLNWSLEYYEEHIDECNRILNLLDDYEKILLLDSGSLSKLTDGSLVRYRGMIQDMLNPEYYSYNFTVMNKDSKETHVKSGKYRDIASCKDNEEVNLRDVDFVPKERLLFFCVPIPGTNDWVYDHEKTTSIQQNEEFSSNLKRHASDDTMDMDITESPQNNCKKNKSVTQKAENNVENYIYDNSKYFPIPNANNLPCIIKVYEEEEKTGFVLNDKVEVVGFLSLNPALEANWDNTNVEDKALHPPPSLVPRIHVIKVIKLRHCNPLLKQIISYDNIHQLIESARSDLHLILTQLFFEDTLAADYVLCNLISRIYIRNESSTIGKFSLNLFNISIQNFASSFYAILKTLVTNSHYMPLTTNSLNEKSFVPRKDYESSRLWSGILQLCDDVHLILDETKMNEGQLNNTGCLNVAAIQRLLRDQEVEYDFGYYPVRYITNIPVIVISEGKSMFEADVPIKVNSEQVTEGSMKESFEAVQSYLNKDVLNKIRIYLTAVRLQDFDLGENMMKKIGEDYVSLRQQDKHVSSSDLHMLLILSRLLALSRGRTILEPADWSRAIGMETERKMRLK